MRPLIKWAGGKRQIMSQIVKYLPLQWEHYYEPFAGGLALLVELHGRGQLGDSTISDSNPELINLYRVMKDRPHELAEALASPDFRNEENSYYRTRERFNSILGKEEHCIERAATFIYLNRHAYNGLWRVNRRGEFNVPFGKYVNPTLPDRNQIKEFSLMLKNVAIVQGDFQTAVEGIGPLDFVYFDPPYIPLTSTARFTDYTNTGFGPDDQERLLSVCGELDRKGVRFMLSNSYSRQNEEFYGEFTTIKVEARRNISCKSSQRAGHHELLVLNYKPEAKQETVERVPEFQGSGY